MATLASLSINNNRICRGGSTEGTLGFGICALQSTNGGNIRNTAFASALQSPSLSSCYNTAIGVLAGCANTSGQQNTSVGHYAGRAITTPYQNNALGFKALCSQTTGCRQIALGACAMYNSCTGNASIGVGFKALTCNANCSVAIGAYAQALGNRSVAIGYDAQANGNNSVAIGSKAQTNEDDNVSIGYNTKANGICNIAIGYNTNVGGYSNVIVIAPNTTIYRSNAIYMGNATHGIYNCVYVDWTYCSDRNEKTNIETLSYNFGLPLIKKLRPVKFNWDIREKYVQKCGFEFGQKDGTLVQEKENYGLIAQELEQALKELNLRFDALKVKPTKYQISETHLLAPLVKSIQQLSNKLDIIKERLTVLETN